MQIRCCVHEWITESRPVLYQRRAPFLQIPFFSIGGGGTRFFAFWEPSPLLLNVLRQYQLAQRSRWEVSSEAARTHKPSSDCRIMFRFVWIPGRKIKRASVQLSPALTGLRLNLEARDLNPSRREIMCPACRLWTVVWNRTTAHERSQESWQLTTSGLAGLSPAVAIHSLAVDRSCTNKLSKTPELPRDKIAREALVVD